MQINNSVLLIDDDSEHLLSLIRALKNALPSITFNGAGNTRAALEAQQKYAHGCAVVDLELIANSGPQSGFDLISELVAHDPQLRVIVLTGHGGIEYGIEAIKRGAVSFQEKPAHIHELSVLIKDFLHQYNLRSQAQREKSVAADSILDQLVGDSDISLRFKNEIEFAASTNQPIFLSGESGVGKSLCAQIIHRLSARSKKSFVRYQPSFVSADLVNSDLFGHKKGSFTGADSDRKGLLSEAEGGTLFLDEVDALPVETQVTLLSVLQDRTYRQVGANQEIQTNIRLITASNTLVDEAITTGKIRKDFYFRSAHHTIAIPPLRQRLSELPALSAQFLKAGRDRKDFSVFSISKAALSMLQQYDWPGNIRELQAVIEGAAYRAQYHSRFEIEPTDIIIGVMYNSASPITDSSDQSFHDKVLSYKQKLVMEALEKNGGNQVKAAKELGLDRSVLRRLLK